MATIEKKIWPEYFDAVASGAKKWELRLNDFYAQPGDALLLKEWNPDTKQYTGRTLEKKIIGVQKFSLDKLFWPKEEVEQKGFQILTLA